NSVRTIKTMAEAFVTLATNDSYALGAIVWANSLRNVNTTKQICVMITDGVSLQFRQALARVADHVEMVQPLDSSDPANLALLGRPNLGCTFTKLHCWRLIRYTKAVFMDSDTLVMANIDDLLEREELSAAPDPGWPDCFNSGVFVYRPSEDTYRRLLDFARSCTSFDGADQGLLNMFFNDWATKDITKHLPFTYNCVSQAFYSYLPAFRHFRRDIKVAHFIGEVKPWHHSYNSATGQVEPREGTGHQSEFLQHWWDIYVTQVHAMLPAGAVSSQGERIALSQQGGGGDGGGGGGGAAGGAAGGGNRREAWERGEIDYLGSDRFDNVLSRLRENIQD
ncbi:hypothetical protein BOX15_Mlig012577g1, partial [Macrostomum lignano]